MRFGHPGVPMLMPETEHFAKPTLAQLLEGECAVNGGADIGVRKLQIDSRSVAVGDVFLALQGERVDGRAFITDAILAGAVAVLVEAGEGYEETRLESGVPVIPVADLWAKAGILAARLHQHPSEQLEIIAVTGTNGKTSCTQFIAEALQAMGRRCGVMGTIGYGLPGAFQEASHTTPDAVQVQAVLADLVERGAEMVALEASSHGLEQGRLNGVRVKTAVFTNLSRDHLDYHKTMQAYGDAKRRLFRFEGLENAVLNIDDEFGQQLSRNLPESIRRVTYSLESDSADVYTRRLNPTGHGFEMEVVSPWGACTLSTSLLGAFNVANLLAAFSVLGLHGLKVDEIARALGGLKGVSGRMDCVSAEGVPTVVVDYAHTPDALESVLKALRAHCAGQLWCVFGCGGNRDAGKRPQMGRIAAELADRVIVTDDNPRRESASEIVAEILSGITGQEQVEVEHNRANAIGRAIGEAGEQDLILIAGKGHETYQEVDGLKWPFSDFAHARIAIDARGQRT